MSREHLYKAKRKDWKELSKEEWWVFGHYVATGEKAYIIVDVETDCPDGENTDLYATEWYEVDKDTVCENTGFTGKNDREIFEGDIVMEFLKGIKLKNCKIVWDKEEGSWMKESESGLRYGVGTINSENIEVIGNIFDNPELLQTYSKS